MKCNLCGGSEFLAQGRRPQVRCSICHSLERTRLLWMYLRQLPLDRETRVLHMAPERGIYAALSKLLDPEKYDVCDIAPSNYRFVAQIRKLDLCELDHLPRDHYDLILHSHVLEHVPCNVAYTLYHLHRALKPRGIHMCVIPFLPGHYDECFAEIGDKERVRRFGQHDHVRRFGQADIHRSLGPILRIDTDFDATRDFAPSQLEEANIPQYAWRGLTTHTVQRLHKDDMTLLGV